MSSTEKENYYIVKLHKIQLIKELNRQIDMTNDYAYRNQLRQEHARVWAKYKEDNREMVQDYYGVKAGKHCDQCLNS